MKLRKRIMRQGVILWQQTCGHYCMSDSRQYFPRDNNYLDISSGYLACCACDPQNWNKRRCLIHGDAVAIMREFDRLESLPVNEAGQDGEFVSFADLEGGLTDAP